MPELDVLGKGPHGHGGDRRPAQLIFFLHFLPDIVENGHPDCTAQAEPVRFRAAIDWAQTNHSTAGCPHDQQNHRSTTTAIPATDEVSMTPPNKLALVEPISTSIRITGLVESEFLKKFRAKFVGSDQENPPWPRETVNTALEYANEFVAVFRSLFMLLEHDDVR